MPAGTTRPPLRSRRQSRSSTNRATGFSDREDAPRPSRPDARSRPSMRPEHLHRDAGGVDSTAAWLRLARAVLLSTIGGVGMWSVVVVLPSVEADFGVARAGATLPV